jgi:hypothetical protein
MKKSLDLSPWIADNKLIFKVALLSCDSDFAGLDKEKEKMSPKKFLKKIDIVGNLTSGAGSISIYPGRKVRVEHIRMNDLSIEKNWETVGKHLQKSISSFENLK